MSPQSRARAHHTGDVQTTGQAVRRWLTASLPGRALVLGAATKAVVALASRAGIGGGVLPAIDVAGSIALVVGGVALAWQLFLVATRRMLWRVRRKLTLSYIFIGFVPALLIICFFLLAGLLLFFNVSSYLMQSRIRALTDETRFFAQTAALEVQRSGSVGAVGETLDRREASLASRYPGASLAMIPASLACPGVAPPAGRPSLPASVLDERLPMMRGAWRHLEPPTGLPSWVSCRGFAGLLAYADVTPGAASGRTRLVVRAVAVPDVPTPRFAVVLDVPISTTLANLIRDETGIAIGDVSPLREPANGQGVRPVPGRAGATAPDEVMVSPGGAPKPAAPASAGGGGGRLNQPLGWVTFLTYTDWETGKTDNVSVAIGMSVAEIYERISAMPVGRVGTRGFGQIFLLLLAIVGGLFLVIQLVALVMGLALARSITGAVHGLFTGTERVRQGDFTHKIAVRSRDQLGELAESFNSMTGSIEDLLKQKAEKERLEQELQIARQIQMSLLPQGPFLVPGLSITAHCEPAREVGGDYYDFLPIDADRLGLLIADVSGKGTSAALYMAELKGLMLSLSQLHESPRRLLVDANRIIADHLDHRSFITMTYAVVDLRARTFTYARAGHCPLIYLPGPYAGARRAALLAPDGMVLGLKLDDGSRFDALLDEATIPLGPGDLVVLFTDGITEAMDEAGDCFGEDRLLALVEEHGGLPFDQLRERIIREVKAFAGAAGQHDDMTMLLVKVEG